MLCCESSSYFLFAGERLRLSRLVYEYNEITTHIYREERGGAELARKKDYCAKFRQNWSSE